MTPDEYKRAFGILLREGKDGEWVGTTADPFGRRQRGGKELPRTLPLPESSS